METVHLDVLGWREFEQLCGRILRKSWMCRVEQIGGVADGGRDLIIHGRGGKIVVECKYWRNKSIGRPIVQKLHSAVVSERATKGMVITTGRYTAKAEECVRQLPGGVSIKLRDLNWLADQAQAAGIRLVTGSGDSVIHDLPATDMAGLRAMLSGILAPVKSHPASAAELLETTLASLRLEAYYVVTANVDQDFTTGAGRIRSVHEHGIRGVYSARDGSRTDRARASFLLEGARLGGPPRIPAVPCPVYKEDFALGGPSLKRIVAERLIRKYSSTVRYTGRNRVSYRKDCRIGPRSVHITDIRQVRMPKYVMRLGFLKKRYRCSLVQNGDGARITDSDLYECGVCGRHAGEACLLCNSCGAMAHAPRLFGSHSHRCGDCKKTICGNCAFWVRRLLLFKRMLCGRCADRRPGARRAR